MINVVYPVPNETAEVWDIFKPFVERFVTTWKKHGPGVDCSLVPVLFGPDDTNTVYDLFEGLPIDQFEYYQGSGCDIGAAQWIASLSEPDDFVVALTTRVYFHSPRWLDKMMWARRLLGPGLYGTSASMEGGKLHCCTRCYGMEAKLWNAYPHLIDTRDLGTSFEVGRDNPVGPLSDWVEDFGFPACIVYRCGAFRKPLWLTPANIFRKGDQSNLLVWDKHTDAYRDADKDEQSRLRSMAYGLQLSPAKSPLM